MIIFPKSFNSVFHKVKRKPILLYGVSGVGKTTIVGAIPYIFNVPCGSINAVENMREFLVVVDDVEKLDRNSMIKLTNRLSLGLPSIITTKCPEQLPKIKGYCNFVNIEYSFEDMVVLVEHWLAKLKISYEIEAMKRLVLFTRLIPKLAKQAVWLINKMDGMLDSYTLQKCLAKLGIDQNGLMNTDKIYMKGLQSLKKASMRKIIDVTFLDKYIINYFVEPHLERLGYLVVDDKNKREILENIWK